MGLSSIADTFFALRFLRLLTTPWKKTGAYKAGIIDEDGKVLKKAAGSDKAVYNMFHRLVFNVKRLLNKVPFGKTSIASYGAALLMIKEQSDLSEEEMGQLLEEAFGISDIESCIGEMNESIETLPIGTHQVNNGIRSDGESVTTSIIITEKNRHPHNYIFNQPVYRAYSLTEQDEIAFNLCDIVENNVAGGTNVVPQPFQELPNNGTGKNWKVFDVKPETFHKFSPGRKKFQRWSAFLNFEDEADHEVYQYAKKKPNDTVVLRCCETGAMRSIRRRGQTGN